MPELRGSPPPPEIERREGLTKEARLGGRESGRRVVKHVSGSDVLYGGDIKDDKCGRSRHERDNFANSSGIFCFKGGHGVDGLTLLRDPPASDY